MKFHPIAVLLSGVLAFQSPSTSEASNVGTGTIEQPVNLGPASDPARIPLGAVGTISNYNYGVHGVIGAPRPCPVGAMRWEGGSELDQNLASVFGISVEPEDSTTVPGRPVTIRMEPWNPPAYSPYSKEQVLAATLWCLIRSAGGTLERPLEVRVVAATPGDKALEAKYSGKFVSSPGKDGIQVGEPVVPGTRIETDGRGISWVVFPEVTKSSPPLPASPAMILFAMAGDIDPADGTWRLLPVWGSAGQADVPIQLNQQSVAMTYHLATWKGSRETNAIAAAGGSVTLTRQKQENGDRIRITHPVVPQATLAANVLALVISDQPTKERPLTVEILMEEQRLAKYPAFRGTHGWAETRGDSGHVSLTRDFVWDPVGHKLSQGSVPLVSLSGDTITVLRHESPAETLAGDYAKETLRRINQGIHNGLFLAEKAMPPTLCMNLAFDGKSARPVTTADLPPTATRWESTQTPRWILPPSAIRISTNPTKRDGTSEEAAG